MTVSKNRINFTDQRFRVLLVLVGTVVAGVLVFFINNLTGLFTAFSFIIQALVGILFGLWCLRIALAYIKELRKKEPERKVGVPTGWSIFGLVAALANFIIWGFLSTVIFNFPKIVFLIPSLLGMVQISHVLAKGNRRNVRDWLLLLYNCFALWYLFTWTLVDFGVDVPLFFGIFNHTITSGSMFWQLFYVNAGAFFSPTFIFPLYLLNPRYYFAMPVEEYFELRAAAEKEAEAKLSDSNSDDKEETETQEPENERLTPEEISRLPGDRVPFFDERKKEREMSEEAIAIKREMTASKKEDDQLYAEFVGSNDVRFMFRKFIGRFDNFLRVLALGVILILIIITPIMFAGNISMNLFPKAQRIDYPANAGMVVAVEGKVFSTINSNGNISAAWESELANEISWAEELGVTHIRYDLKSRALSNNATKASLDTGLQQIKDAGIKLILSIEGDFSYTIQEYKNFVYLDAQMVATNYEPDYMIIFNELNGEMLSSIFERSTINDWLPAINNVSSTIKTNSPSTKVISSVLAFSDGITYFKSLLNDSILLDVVGVSFYPILFGWRLGTLNEYASAFKITGNGSKSFWISETGMESFNFGESAQARYIAKIFSMATDNQGLNATGVCIKSLVDNTGFSINLGIRSHLGLIYYNGRKKEAFTSLKYITGEIFESS